MPDQITTAMLARGRWKEILQSLGVPAKLLNKRGQPCPFCGGRDRFQWKDYEGKGSYICRGCGNGDGFELLKKLHGWTYRQAADAIDKLLRTNTYVSMHPDNRPVAEEIKIPKSTRDCALWLRKYRPHELEDWLDHHTPDVRWWLETQT